VERAHSEARARPGSPLGRATKRTRALSPLRSTAHALKTRANASARALSPPERINTAVLVQTAKVKLRSGWVFARAKPLGSRERSWHNAPEPHLGGLDASNAVPLPPRESL